MTVARVLRRCVLLHTGLCIFIAVAAIFVQYLGCRKRRFASTPRTSLPVLFYMSCPLTCIDDRATSPAGCWPCRCWTVRLWLGADPPKAGWVLLASNASGRCVFLRVGRRVSVAVDATSVQYSDLRRRSVSTRWTCFLGVLPHHAFPYVYW